MGTERNGPVDGAAPRAAGRDLLAEPKDRAEEISIDPWKRALISNRRQAGPSLRPHKVGFISDRSKNVHGVEGAALTWRFPYFDPMPKRRRRVPRPSGSSPLW